jgi:plasmid maintenance system antidote protein VapI
MPSNTYKNLKKKYNLNTISEYYYDQRHKISRFLKEEIYAKALHPDRIEKILELSGDSWINLDDYI